MNSDLVEFNGDIVPSLIDVLLELKAKYFTADSFKQDYLKVNASNQIHSHL
jgi:hypothetical protein